MNRHKSSAVNIKKAPFWNNVKVVPYLYILPNLILFLAFMILPLLMSAYYSLVKWNGLGKPKFVGLTNYFKLFQDSAFLTSLWNTFKFTLLTVPLLMLLALLLALFLNQKLKARGFFRSALYLPSIISMVAVGMVFLWMFNPQIGLINFMIEKFGFQKIDWLNDPNYAMAMIVIGTLWSRIGYNMVIYISGIQGISPEYYEAATIDGANGFQKFMHVTLPLLKGTHVFVLITCVIASFKTFDLIYVMTKGGPLNSTKTLVVYIYETAFQKNNYGMASAAGIILFVLLMVFTIVQFRGTKKEG